jgi:hypothetical protein
MKRLLVFLSLAAMLGLSGCSMDREVMAGHVADAGTFARGAMSYLEFLEYRYGIDPASVDTVASQPQPEPEQPK